VCGPILCTPGGAAPAHIICHMPSSFVCVYQPRSFQGGHGRRWVGPGAVWGYWFSRPSRGVRSCRSVGTKSCARKFSSTSLNQVYALLVCRRGCCLLQVPRVSSHQVVKFRTHSQVRPCRHIFQAVLCRRLGSPIWHVHCVAHWAAFVGCSHHNEKLDPT
jgi:hypothetical protein